MVKREKQDKTNGSKVSRMIEPEAAPRVKHACAHRFFLARIIRTGQSVTSSGIGGSNHVYPIKSLTETVHTHAGLANSLSSGLRTRN